MGLCALLYVVLISLVGARMLLLARRSGGRPELLIGMGSVLVAGVGFPTSLLSGFGKPVGEVHVALWIASESITQLGIVLLYGFTQQVFRPGVAWAKALVIAVAAYLPVGLLGAGHALATAAPDQGSVPATSSWLLLCFVGYGGCFVWSALESLHQRDMARRRGALGLADRFVANRFLLYAIYGIAATGILAANAAGVLLGQDISASPIVLVPSALLGVVASVAMYLAFVPPAWYRERVRAGVRP